MKAIFCPVCGGSDLYHEAGGMIGKYHCKRCDYVGVFVIEKDSDEAHKDENAKSDLFS